MTVKHPLWTGPFIMPLGNCFGTTVGGPVIGHAALVFICLAAISRSWSVPAIRYFKFICEMLKSA